MNTVREIEKINERELELGIKVGQGSWHDEYADSAYVYMGGLPTDITEGDVLIVASQFGTVIDVNLVRDRETGASKGFAFVAYADQRSTVLAVDNFTGAQFFNRTLRCDHVPSYRIPSKKKQKDKKRAVTDDSTSSESETDSELELYRGATDGLNPLQRRMIRAKVKRDLARQAGADLPPSDDEQQRDAKDAGKKRFTHSFYAVEETSEERKKRRKHEKHEAKRARKQERRAAKAAERNASAAETVSSTTPAATTAAPQGGMSNPFLAAKLREMAQRERD